MAFYLSFEHKGKDLYPRLHQIIEDGRVPDGDRVRFEMMKHLGYYPTESSEHFSEYVPYFIKKNHEELIERFNIPIDEYIRRCIEQNKGWERLREEMMSDQEITVGRSHEYGSLIIHSMETGTPRVIYGNVLNDSLIENLPMECAVEVPCLVDRNGIQPTAIGAMPPHLAALIQTNVNPQILTVEAILTGNRDHVYHAAMMDPHTSAELTLDEIHSLVDDCSKPTETGIPDISGTDGNRLSGRNAEMAVEAVTARYEFTLDDAVAFNDYHFRYSPAGKRARLKHTLLPPAIWLALAAAYSVWTAGRGNPWFVGILVGFSALWVLLSPFQLRRQVRRSLTRRYRRRGGSAALGWHSLTISRAGVWDKSDGGESDVRWQNTVRVAWTPEHLFIYLTETRAHNRPGGAFAGEEDFRAFGTWQGASSKRRTDENAMTGEPRWLQWAKQNPGHCADRAGVRPRPVRPGTL